jgi:serine protease Do
VSRQFLARTAMAAAVALGLTACSAGRPWFSEAPAPSPEASPAPSLAPLEPSRIVEVVEGVGPAVVNVRTNLGQPGRTPEGTGFIIDSSGVVVTNFHVVEGAFEITVISADGRRFEARAIGADENADLAVLRVDATGLPSVELGDSDGLRLGETVVALGFALGLEGGPSVTSGIVSALGRTIRAGGAGTPTRTYEDVIQTDAAINPGNSGGPLVDLQGRVVGINTAGVQAAQAENIGFAIAINRARPIIEHAMEDPEGPSPLLGVTTQPVDELVALELDLAVDRGLLVIEVLANGPADRAGVEPGDVIVGIEGRDVTGHDSLQQGLLEHEPGETVEITVVRGSDTLTVRPVLGVRPLPIET